MGAAWEGSPLGLPVDLTPGRIRCSKREVVLTRGAERLATREDGRKLYDFFSSFEGIGGFQDHFEWWARNQFSSRGGKPLWIDPHDPGVHHIFIDDNIRLDDADTIVHPQSPLASVEVYHVDEGKWEKKAALAQPSMGISAVQRDGVVFSLGGLQQPGPHNFYSRPHFVNTVEMFDPAQGAWSKPSRAVRMREKRADFVAGCLGGRVVAVGGLVPPMPPGRCSCSSCPAPSLLFVIGGVAQGPSSAVEALCLREMP
nr:PREDICTED: kelch domain-containing protein 8B [Opisthocomus hoazin]